MTPLRLITEIRRLARIEMAARAYIATLPDGQNGPVLALKEALGLLAPVSNRVAGMYWIRLGDQEPELAQWDGTRWWHIWQPIHAEESDIEVMTGPVAHTGTRRTHTMPVETEPAETGSAETGSAEVVPADPSVTGTSVRKSRASRKSSPSA